MSNRYVRYYGYDHYSVAPIYVKELSIETVKGESIKTHVLPSASRPRTKENASCVVDGAHAFVLRISSFFGLAPLKFDSRSNGYTVSLSGPMCVYSYVLISVLVLCTILGLLAEMSVGMDRSVRMSSRMSQVVSMCDVLVVAATACSGVYGAPARMKSMLEFMEIVASVDLNIGARYSRVNERKLCAILVAILVFFGVLLVDDFFFYARQASKFGRMWDVALNYLAFYLLWCIVVIVELQFAFSAISLKSRFRAVNDVLAQTARQVAMPLERTKENAHMNMFAIRITPSDDGRGANVGLLVDSISNNQAVIIRKSAINGEPEISVSPCEAVRRLAALHGALCEVVRRLDESYGLPVVAVLISTLLHLIVTPYFLILDIIFSVNRVHFLVLQFVWCVMHMLRMFVIVEPCHYTITEGKRTEDLVCRLIAHAPSTGGLQSRLELFSRQLLMRSVTYTPLGMCTLDRPLVASIIGAVTTYLVILIQFQRYDT